MMLLSTVSLGASIIFTMVSENRYYPSCEINGSIASNDKPVIVTSTSEPKEG